MSCPRTEDEVVALAAEAVVTARSYRDGDDLEAMLMAAGAASALAWVTGDETVHPRDDWATMERGTAMLDRIDEAIAAFADAPEPPT